MVEHGLSKCEMTLHTQRHFSLAKTLLGHRQKADPDSSYYKLTSGIILPVLIVFILKFTFLHDWPWISPWIKSISNELDIIFHVIVSQLFGHCDVISTRLWRHQQNVDRASEPRGRCVKIVVFIVVFGFVISCKKWDNVCTLVTNCLRAHSSVILEFISSLLRNSGNKHQNNLLMSA